MNARNGINDPVAITVLAVFLVAGCDEGKPEVLQAAGISAGETSACALTREGGVRCWGEGPLGDGTESDSMVPLDVAGLSGRALAVTVGSHHTCVTGEGGNLLCWGLNWDGAVGDGSSEDRFLPVSPVGISGGVRDVAAGEDFTCALTGNGRVKCWGRNDDGQLGNGTTENSLVPQDVIGIDEEILDISAKWSHVCALTGNGGVKCWGSNRQGELGTGTSEPSAVPVDVVGISGGIRAVSVGHSFSCALTDEGSLKCWGSEFDVFPQVVEDFAEGIDSFSAGMGLLCAVTTQRGVRCLNFYTLPGHVDVEGLGEGVEAVSAGDGFACARLENDKIRCWGDNDFGQLGNGTATSSEAPVDVVGF